ncbi:hypothetical protein [Phaeobacter inhibens]|uniref:hypothetical protein n=1 Tax=Phaeobacter inhibens TaxID=221822 RepID=UPI0021A5FDCA|nr:hypothetical protein [Phaeobacter inhibens]UWR43625.1 hypothetical protein K4F86_09595 [Phaeobacter inhibens]
MKKLFMATTLLAGVPASIAAQICSDFMPDPMVGFAPLEIELYLDLPVEDPIAAAMPLELTMVDAMIQGTQRQVTKTYCQIGIQRMIIDFAVPVEDDAFSDWVTRSVYEWDATAEPIGWRLDQLGDRGRCARGDDPFAAICP